MVMAPADPQRAWWIDWSAASESHRQSQLPGVRAVAGVTGHYYHCVAANPGARKKKRKRATGPPAGVMAGRDGGHFLVAVYGGYFGEGIGILMIGALSFISPGEIRHVVALRNLLNGWMRGIAVLVLVLDGSVDWKYGAPMAVGGLVGGYIGGNCVASRKPDRCSLDRYRDRSCRVSTLFLEVVRPDCDARRRRVGGNSDARAPCSLLFHSKVSIT